MSSNTENTEAKLAAYIDGQLNDTERAQIEQHLQANPEHRKLLADLIAQRAALRSLPREKAPSDIYDSLQAQLERSILLDDSAESAPVVIRHSRRSQFFAIAAILLLAIGLCGVLYFALPSFSRRPAIEVASRPADLPTTLATTDSEADRKPSEPETNMQEQAGTTLAEAPEKPATLPAEETKLADAASLYPNQLVVLVSSADPTRARQQVATYLESNNIRWEAVHNTPADQVTQAAVGRFKALTVSQSPATLQNKQVLSPIQQPPTDKDLVLATQRPRNFIIARGMTRQQATELTDTLSSETPTQRARLLFNTPTQAKIAESKVELQETPLNLGQELRPSPPTTEPTADALATTSAPPPPATATGALGALEPTTRQAPTAAAPPSNIPVGAAPLPHPTTTPSPATQPDETGVDVVILVEDQPSSPATTTAPTTQEAPTSQPTE